MRNIANHCGRSEAHNSIKHVHIMKLMMMITFIMDPLYVAFVDFAKAFDSIDRILLFGKLQCCGISTKFVKPLWPLINEKYVQIISGRNVSDNILQTKGIPQGQCLSPHLYSIFTADMPTAITHDS